MGSAPAFNSLRWEQAGHVGTVTLNRPDKLNAMSWEMFVEIGAVFELAAATEDVRVVVVTGEGRGFCSGADLTDPANHVTSALDARDRMRKIHSIAAAIVNCPKPTVARVTGIAAGAGCNLALGCDFVIAAREASFAELFVKRGLVVDFGGSWALTRALGIHKAKELALLGDTISAEEADRLGLIYRLCDEGEIDVAVKELTDRLAGLPPKTVQMIKENLNRASERSLEENLDAESAGQALALTSEDTREAVLAWIEKREPRFTGK